MRILRYPSLTEEQALGCLCAFTDALEAELKAAAQFLHRLQGQEKGRAFAFEMELDAHRYGVVITVDRWRQFAGAFGPHLAGTRMGALLENAPQSAEAATALMERLNEAVDSAPAYSGDLISACTSDLDRVLRLFDGALGQASETMSLGPMLSEDFREARRIFASDLASR